MEKVVDPADFAIIEEVSLDNMKWCYAEDALEKIELSLVLLNIDERQFFILIFKKILLNILIHFYSFNFISNWQKNTN